MDRNTRFEVTATGCATSLFWFFARVITTPLAMCYLAKDWMARREDEWIEESEKWGYDGEPPPRNIYRRGKKNE